MFFKDQFWSLEGGTCKEISRGASIPCSSCICLLLGRRQILYVPSRWLFDGAWGKAPPHGRKPVTGKAGHFTPVMKQGEGEEGCGSRQWPASFNWISLLEVSADSQYCIKFWISQWSVPWWGQHLWSSLTKPLTEFTFCRSFLGPLQSSCLSSVFVPHSKKATKPLLTP